MHTHARTFVVMHVTVHVTLHITYHHTYISTHPLTCLDRVGGLEVIGITDLVFRILEILDDDGDRRTSRGCKTITYITKRS